MRDILHMFSLLLGHQLVADSSVRKSVQNSGVTEILARFLQTFVRYKVIVSKLLNPLTRYMKTKCDSIVISTTEVLRK